MEIVKPPVWYEINWDNVKSLEDVKVILSCLGLQVTSDHRPDFDTLNRI